MGNQDVGNMLFIYWNEGESSWTLQNLIIHLALPLAMEFDQKDIGLNFRITALGGKYKVSTNKQKIP